MVIEYVHFQTAELLQGWLLHQQSMVLVLPLLFVSNTSLCWDGDIIVLLE